MINVLELSLEEVRNLLRNGEISANTLTEETIQRCKKYEKLNAYITLCEDDARFMASESCDRLTNHLSQNSNPEMLELTNDTKDSHIGALEGIPLCVKDMFCTKNIKTTAGSCILSNFIAPYESSVTTKLKNAGYVLIGKTNMDEFAMGSSNEYSYFGPVRNPWNENKVPGGSSGGTAAAVAAGLAYAGLGSDTGGSVRQPAAFCGIVGVKPSYGRCSRHGMVAYASSFDQAGVMARTVQDVCIVLDEIMGPCALDSTTIQECASKLSKVKPSLKGKKIVYFRITEEAIQGNPSAEKAWKLSLDALKQQGAEIYVVESKVFHSLNINNVHPMYQWISTYYTLTPSEAIANLARYDGIRYGSMKYNENGYHSYESVRSQFGAEVQRRILLGSHILSTKHDNEFFQRACMYRQIMQKDFAKLFSQFDAVISPTSIHEAWDIGYKFEHAQDMYLEDMFTVIANLINAPAISIPVCLGENQLPMGLQVMCNYMRESTMIEIAKALEAEFNFNDIRQKELFNKGVKVDQH